MKIRWMTAPVRSLAALSLVVVSACATARPGQAETSKPPAITHVENAGNYAVQDREAMLPDGETPLGGLVWRSGLSAASAEAIAAAAPAADGFEVTMSGLKFKDEVRFFFPS